MPSQESRSALPNIPANLSLQKGLNEQRGKSLDSLYDITRAVDSGSLTDNCSTPFPSLTGSRSRTNVGKRQKTTFGSKVRFVNLRQATSSLGASPIAALQAAWAVILSTYSAAEEDVTYTTIIASPDSHSADHLCGDAFLAVPTRVCLGTPQKWGQRTNGSILKDLTESNALALHRNRKASKQGTMIALESEECSEADLEVINGLLKGEELSVSLLAWPDIAGFLKLKVLYTDNFLNETSALVMLEQLDDVLAFVLAHPSKPLSRSLAAIRPSLLSISNEYPQECTELNFQAPYLHAQFENFAKDSPDRIALDFRVELDSEKSSDNTTWTYEQLNKKAEIFAMHLIHRFGQLADEVIPICMERRPELYVALLGILKAGAAWCPIDPSFPTRRCHDLIARTGARMLVVAEQELADGTRGVPRGVLTIGINCIEDTVADGWETSNARMGSLAYLIWTSGTSGEPKGVPIHHEAVVTSMRALQRCIPTDVRRGIVRCLQFSQFTFDVFIQDLFYTWGVGGTIISSTKEIMLASFAELATKTNATHAHLTPAFAASVPRERCPTLEVITMIGEKLPQAVADDWSQNMRSFNTYGPAETTIVSTFRQFGAAEDITQSQNVGFPLASVSAFVMRDGQPLMRQGIGELALGGPQLSKGYWHDPSRSSEKFVWNKQYSRQLYMTGDLVRQLYDGSLEFVGRTDDLIKIQGVRVELSEIGFCLRFCHPLIEQVEVQYLSRQDRPLRAIVAFLAAPTLGNAKEPGQLIASEEAAPIAKSALVAAQKRLPAYMIPSIFLVIDSIPRTSSAKTDKAILKNIYSLIDLGLWEGALASENNNTGEVATWSMRESEFIAIIAELSGTSPESMARASDLRSIGIDSISATRLASMATAKGFLLSVADILQCQSLDDLFKVTDKSIDLSPQATFDLLAFHKEWYPRVREEIKRSDVFVAPALPLQESLLSESMQNASAYWSHTFFSLNAQVDNTRLYEAWLQVVSNTEALRTGFIPSAAVSGQRDEVFVSNSTFMQLIYNTACFDWTCVNSSEVDIKKTAKERARAVAECHQKNHFKDPLVAVTIFEQPNRRSMMVSIHHSVRDEVSLDLIIEDVGKRYHNVVDASKQRRQLRDALQVMLPTEAQTDRDEEFWAKALDDFNTIDDAYRWPDLTGKNTRSEDLAAVFKVHTHPLKRSYKNLQGAALGLGATSVASILRVAWGSVLLEYLETDRLVFAETCSNRNDDRTLANVVGPLMTVLPMPFRALGSTREAVIAQSSFQKESRAHRSIRAQVIRKLLGRPEQQALYPAVFNFLPEQRDGSRNGCSSLWEKTDNIVGLTVEHPLALNVAQAADGVLELELSAGQNVMSSDHLAMLALQLDAFLEAMLRSPDMPLTQLSSGFPKELLSLTSVSFSEKVRLAQEQNPTDWVDHYATLHPHWPAAEVVTAIGNDKYESESWNFSKLRSAYKGVAAFISHSNCVNRMIAVCLDRRLEAYAIILGILASGNIYLPIDEDLPPERKLFLLQDSTAAMLFTTRSLDFISSSIRSESRVVYVDDSTCAEHKVNDESVNVRFHPKASDNAYLLYTSGSTGLPKGVLVGRGNLCSFIEGLSEFICPLIPGMKELPGKGKYLGLASRAFDVHIAEMFLAWRQGLAAVTAPRTMLLDNLELALRKLKITHASFVPSLIDQAGLDPAHLPDLHYLGVGGETMSKHVIDTWAPNENAALVNAYGPTEMSIGCTAAEVTQESNLRNVGRPYGNSVAHVLVPGSGRYTLRGVAGELCFTGDLVANGYHNRPNAKGFVEDFEGKRMYRTGDIVRLMADETVEYLRREDDQTKVRGQRLELGEISEAIRSSAVSTLGLCKVDVATMVAQHPKLSKSQIVSFVVPIPFADRVSGPLTRLCSSSDYTVTSKIQAECQKVLPAYMVPDVIVPIKRLPLAPSSGKADLKRLKLLFADIPIAELMHHDSYQSESGRQELTKAERIVRSAVMSTLAVDATKIATNTNIFRLGLDSLSAISLAIRMQRLGYACTVSRVLRNPTVGQLAVLPQRDRTEWSSTDNFTEIRSRLADLESRFRASHSHDLNSLAIQAVKPCMPLQETIIATSGALYTNHMTLRLLPEIDKACLHRAWASVVADHGILRTCFQEFENGIVQVVLKYDEFGSTFWEEIATSGPELASQLQQNEITKDIVSGIAHKPPMRLSLFWPPSNDRTSILLFSIHHALYDRESISMILEEVKLRYHSGIPSAHTPFDSMIEHVCSQDQEASKAFWSDYLAHYRPILMTNQLNNTDEEPNNNHFSIVDRIFASPLIELEKLSSLVSGTMTSTIQAIFGVILAQTSGIHDVVFGAVLSGRTVPIESPHTIVAPCIATIPQRVDLGNNDSTILDVVKVAQQGFVASLEFQHTALGCIHRWLGAEKPLFDCLVSYTQKKHSKPDPYPQLWTELESFMPNDFPLSVEFEADHGTDTMRAHCTFSAAFGDLDRAASLLENIDLLLGALVRRENVTPIDLSFSNSHVVDSKPMPQVWDESDWTPKELRMQELAAEICGISAKDISKGASFFRLGIDSIIAIRFARCLRQSGLECSSADVMRHSCIGALAQKIEAVRPHINHIENIAEQPLKRKLMHNTGKVPILGPTDTVIDMYACTSLQSSMLTQTLGSNGRLYVHHHAVRLARHIDLTRLKQAWECLTVKTEILRTTFHFSNSTNCWLGAVHQKSQDAWTECGIGKSISEMLTHITEHCEFNEEADFEKTPWRTTVLRTATEIVFSLSIHHSLYDGESIKFLFQDLARLYQNVELPRRAPFSDAARAISKSKMGAEGFWLQSLEGFEQIETVPSQKDTETVMIEAETTLKIDIEEILQGCKDMGVTIQTVALLAYGKSLAYVSERRDVVFGHVVGCRSLAMPGADEVIGPLFNTVPLRIVFDKTYMTNKAAALVIQRSSGDSQPHQHASLGRIQQAWRQKVGDANAQLFETLFVVQNKVNEALSTGELWTPLDIGGAVAPTEYSTNFEFGQGREEIILKLASRKGLMTLNQLQAWLSNFEQIFEDILKHPQRSVMAFPGSFQALPHQIGSRRSRPSPHDEIEPGPDLECIRTALSETSGITQEDIPVHAGIFSLGLDSISAIRVAAACRKQGYGVSVADVVQGRSLGGICRRVRERSLLQDSQAKNQSTLISPESRSNALVIENVTDEEVENVLPCLAGQLYHIASWLNSGRRMCEATWSYQCLKRLNVDELRFAWRGLRERHSVLRTMFVAVSSRETVQVVLKQSALNDNSFERLEAPDDSNDKVIGQIKQEAKRPFDFFSPPSKLRLVRGKTQDFVVLRLHHATYDAWTVQTIVEDLAALYRNVGLPAPPRFESFIHQTVYSLHTKPEEAYWRKSMEHCQQTLLQPSLAQSDTYLPASTTSTSIFVTIKSAIANLQALEASCRHFSTSLPTIILLAFARALARHTSTTNPTFGLYQAGRSASFKNIEQLCAPCLNVTPLVIPDALERPILESAQGLQADLAERVDFEQSYLHEVLEWMGFGREPLFDTFVNILSYEGSRSPNWVGSEKGNRTGDDALFVPCQFGDSPMDLAPAEPTMHGKTAVDGLEVGYLAEKNLYLDVVRSVEDDCVDFGIRCDTDLMDEESVRRFASQIATEVEKISEVVERN